jgi:hypothetical protein
MTDLAGPRLMRWRLIERLVELASPADVQLAYLGSRGTERMSQKVWDLAVDFWEWSYFLPELVRQGVVPLDVESMVTAVVSRVQSMDHEAAQEWEQNRSNWLHSPEALASDPRWSEVRNLAGQALEGFKALGLPTPSLTDGDFNVPREDAP